MRHQNWGKTLNLTASSLKDLGLHTAYDVSKWSAARGIVPVYLQRLREKNHHAESYAKRGTVYYAIMDSTLPLPVVEQLHRHPDEDRLIFRSRAIAHIESKYDIPVKTIRALGAYFPAPAVDLLMYDLANYFQVYGKAPSDLPPLSKATLTYIKDSYPTPVKEDVNA